MKELTDCELVQIYTHGNEKGLEILLKRYQNSIYTYIFSKIPNNNIVDDIFQDTFFKVISTLKKGKYIEKGKFVSWIFRIAHNRIIDYFRKKNKVHLISETSFYDNKVNIFDIIPASELQHGEIDIKAKLEKEIIKLIDKLPRDQVQIIQMRIYSEYSFKDIAEELNLSINTCLGRMRYALINLRKMINIKYIERL